MATNAAPSGVRVDHYLRPTRAAALCPQCGKYSEAWAKFCDNCGHTLCNPLVVASDILNYLSFGTILGFIFKLTAAAILCTIVFMIPILIIAGMLWGGR